MPQGSKIVIKDFNFYYESLQVLRNITIDFQPNQIFTIFGPAVKTTVIKPEPFNRLFREQPPGTIFLDGMDIYDPKVNLTHQKRIGWSQSSNPTSMSIFDNVAYD
jgi:ABC-type phosphate transport system ATPase subunit